MTHHPSGVIPGHPAGSDNRPVRTRRIAAATLLVLGTIFWIAFGFGIWAKRQALDTDNWVDTSGQLLENENIRTTLGVLRRRRALQQPGRPAAPGAGAPARAVAAGGAGVRGPQGDRPAQRAPPARHLGRPDRLGGGQPQGARDRARDRGRRRRREGGHARPGGPVQGGRERGPGCRRTRSTRSRRTSPTCSWPRPTRSVRCATGSTCSRRSSGCCWAWRSPASPARSPFAGTGAG